MEPEVGVNDPYDILSMTAEDAEAQLETALSMGGHAYAATRIIPRKREDRKWDVAWMTESEKRVQERRKARLAKRGRRA